MPMCILSTNLCTIDIQTTLENKQLKARGGRGIKYVDYDLRHMEYMSGEATSTGGASDEGSKEKVWSGLEVVVSLESVKMNVT